MFMVLAISLVLIIGYPQLEHKQGGSFPANWCGKFAPVDFNSILSYPFIT